MRMGPNPIGRCGKCRSPIAVRVDDHIDGTHLLRQWTSMPDKNISSHKHFTTSTKMGYVSLNKPTWEMKKPFLKPAHHLTSMVFGFLLQQLSPPHDSCLTARCLTIHGYTRRITFPTPHCLPTFKVIANTPARTDQRSTLTSQPFCRPHTCHLSPIKLTTAQWSPSLPSKPVSPWTP